MISRTELLIMLAILAIGTAVIVLLLSSGCVNGSAVP